MNTWLIWNPSSGVLYEAQIGTASFDEVANRAAHRLYGGTHEDIAFKLYISGDNGTSWSEHRFQIEKVPAIVQAGSTCNVADPRPKTKKLVL